MENNIKFMELGREEKKKLIPFFRFVSFKS